MPNSTSIQGAPSTRGVVSQVGWANGLLSRIPLSMPQLALRFALAVPFYRSGLTKWDGWFHLSDSAIYLFSQEFQLHLFGNSIPYPAPNLVALLSGISEIALPILLVLGLATRFAALGLLFMTLVIQLTIPDGWANFHLPWAAMALALVVHGPGKLSVDHLISKRG
jgi:putative oxidoreductase